MVLITFNSNFLFSLLRAILTSSMSFSTEELVDMVFAMGECGQKHLLAARVYSGHFPNKCYPQKQAFLLVLPEAIDVSTNNKSLNETTYDI